MNLSRELIQWREAVVFISVYETRDLGAPASEAGGQKNNFGEIFEKFSLRVETLSANLRQGRPFSIHSSSIVLYTVCHKNEPVLNCPQLRHIMLTDFQNFSPSDSAVIV